MMLGASIALIGTAIGYELLHLPDSTLLLKLGIMSLLMSVYMYLDVKDISLRNNQIVFNTYVKQIAIMLAAWMLEAGVSELLQEKRKKIAQIAVYGLMLADFALMAVSLAGGMGIYDTGIFWAMVQGVVSLLLFILCAIEGKTGANRNGCCYYVA